MPATAFLPLHTFLKGNYDPDSQRCNAYSRSSQAGRARTERITKYNLAPAQAAFAFLEQRKVGLILSNGAAS